MFTENCINEVKESNVNFLSLEHFLELHHSCKICTCEEQILLIFLKTIKIFYVWSFLFLKIVFT